MPLIGGRKSKPRHQLKTEWCHLRAKGELHGTPRKASDVAIVMAQFASLNLRPPQ